MPRLKAFLWDRWSEWALASVIADEPDVIAVDTETEGLAFFDRAFCATLTYRDPHGLLVSAYIDLADTGWERRRDTLFCILESVPLWVAHNWKFDAQKLAAIDALPPYEVGRAVDTQPLASLLDENRRMALKSLAVTELGIEDTVEVVTKSGPNKGQVKLVPREAHHLAAVRRKLKLTKDDGYHLLPREALIPYALRDTELTLLLWERLRPLLPADLEEVYREELEVSAVLLEMEGNGVGIDVPYLTAAADEFGMKVMRGWQRLVELTGDAEFNPNSPIQLKAIFAELGVKLDSTDKASMRDLLANEKSPEAARALARALAEYRSAEKIHGTFLTAMLAEQRDGIIHPNFNSVGPRTGRTSSSSASN